MPNACRPQIQCHWRAQATGPNDQGAAFKNALLAFNADLVEQDVARVAQQQGVIHEKVPLAAT